MLRNSDVYYESIQYAVAVKNLFFFRIQKYMLLRSHAVAKVATNSVVRTGRFGSFGKYVTNSITSTVAASSRACVCHTHASSLRPTLCKESCLILSMNVQVSQLGSRTDISWHIKRLYLNIYP